MGGTTRLRRSLERFRALQAKLQQVDGCEADEAELASHETVLIAGVCETPEDLMAKALYLQDAVSLDTGQVTPQLVTTLVAGIARFVSGDFVPTTA